MDSDAEPLAGRGATKDGEEAEEGEGGEEGKELEVRAILADIVRLGWPTCVAKLCQFLPGVAMLMFLGNEDADWLAGAGMGFMYGNVSGVSLIIGFGLGSAPLISQSFGAQNYVRCGELLQRQLAIHSVLLVLVAVVWLNTKAILVLFGQPVVIAALCQRFILWRIPGLIFRAVNEDLSTFLISMRCMRVPMVVSVIVNLGNVILFPFLIRGLGFIGAPIAITITEVVQAATMMVVTRRLCPFQEQTWPKWSLRTATSQWRELLNLAVPSAFMLWSEWWGWEMNLFFAGQLCDEGGSCVELEVFPILSNTMVLAFMAHMGYSVAAGTLVGNALGAGDTKLARWVAWVTLVFVSFISGAIAALLIIFRHQLGSLFSNDEQIIKLTALCAPLMALYVFLDALGPAALNKILNGMGVVTFPAVINFLSFYAIGIPVGLFCTFGPPRWGIFGLWTGLNLGMSSMVLGLLVYLCCCVDWDAAMKSAQAKAAISPTPLTRNIEFKQLRQDDEEDPDMAAGGPNDKFIEMEEDDDEDEGETGPVIYTG